MRHRLLLLCGFAILAGCSSGPKIVQVSGRVTWDDGKPVANAWVLFKPMGSRDNPNPGQTSTGRTDADGKYTLYIEKDRPGAVAGKHRVEITSVQRLDLPTPETSETGSPDEAPPPDKEQIPDVYNEKSTLEFVVPDGGTDQANFQLKRKP